MRSSIALPFPGVLQGSRTAFRFTRTLLHLLWGCATVAFAFPFLRLEQRRRLKQRWSRQLVAILGIRLIFSGGPAKGLIVANHISFVDIFVINAATPTAFVSKNDVLHWPVIGWLCRHTETIFLQRGNRRAALDTKSLLAEKLRQGSCAAVFPEGTTTAGDQLLPFHGALFQSAVDAGVPVTPVSLRYRTRGGQPSAAPAYIDDISLMDCLLSIMRAEGLVADIRILTPIASDQGDRRQLSDQAHQAIAQTLKTAS